MQWTCRRHCQSNFVRGWIKSPEINTEKKCMKRCAYCIISQVTYYCRSTSSPEYLLRICEGHSHAIHCYGGSIKIISANYGRLTGGHICHGPIKTTNCGAAGSLGKVKNACQGKYYCVLHATNGQFGDPCHGTRKYLEVRSQPLPRLC